jgi:hypothetical protein
MASALAMSAARGAESGIRYAPSGFIWSSGRRPGDGSIEENLEINRKYLRQKLGVRL